MNKNIKLFLAVTLLSTSFTLQACDFFEHDATPTKKLPEGSLLSEITTKITDIEHTLVNRAIEVTATVINGASHLVQGAEDLLRGAEDFLKKEALYKAGVCALNFADHIKDQSEQQYYTFHGAGLLLKKYSGIEDSKESQHLKPVETDISSDKAPTMLNNVIHKIEETEQKIETFLEKHILLHTADLMLSFADHIKSKDEINSDFTRVAGLLLQQYAKTL